MLTETPGIALSLTGLMLLKTVLAEVKEAPEGVPGSEEMKDAVQPHECLLL